MNCLAFLLLGVMAVSAPWVLKAWATKIYGLVTMLGGPGLFIVAMADSSFLSVPEGNDVLIVALSIGQSWSRMCYLVLMTIAGSVLGCTLLYGLGRKGGAFIHRIAKGRLLTAQAMYRKYGVWTIIVACLLPPPAPFKIFVLSAGFFRVSFVSFVLAIFVGRSVRYFAWGVLAVVYGERVKQYVEQNLTVAATLLLVAVLVIGASCLLFRNRVNRLVVRDEEL
ncbi:MAG: DedA family protein [Acidobacteria bacterium]|nr:DedA family protein [Acidobacteriota bacterium]